MLDSKGVISKTRTDLNEQKQYFATDRTDIHTLAEAIRGADVFLGLSKGNVLTQDMVRSMAPNPIVFALANPTPEISYEDAKAARPDVLIATGRSDYPNQIKQRHRLPLHLQRSPRHPSTGHQRGDEAGRCPSHRRPGQATRARRSERGVSRKQLHLRSRLLHTQARRPAPHHRSVVRRGTGSNGQRSGPQAHRGLGSLPPETARTDGLRNQTDTPALRDRAPQPAARSFRRRRPPQHAEGSRGSQGRRHLSPHPAGQPRHHKQTGSRTRTEPRRHRNRQPAPSRRTRTPRTLRSHPGPETGTRRCHLRGSQRQDV